MDRASRSFCWLVATFCTDEEGVDRLGFTVRCSRFMALSVACVGAGDIPMACDFADKIFGTLWLGTLCVTVVNGTPAKFKVFPFCAEEGIAAEGVLAFVLPSTPSSPATSLFPFWTEFVEEVLPRPLPEGAGTRIGVEGTGLGRRETGFDFVTSAL